MEEDIEASVRMGPEPPPAYQSFRPMPTHPPRRNRLPTTKRPTFRPAHSRYNCAGAPTVRSLRATALGSPELPRPVLNQRDRCFLQ